jgi:hypothetical protein
MLLSRSLTADGVCDVTLRAHWLLVRSLDIEVEHADSKSFFMCFCRAYLELGS